MILGWRSFGFRQRSPAPASYHSRRVAYPSRCPCVRVYVCVCVWRGNQSRRPHSLCRHVPRTPPPRCHPTYPRMHEASGAFLSVRRVIVAAHPERSIRFFRDPENEAAFLLRSVPFRDDVMLLVCCRTFNRCYTVVVVVPLGGWQDAERWWRGSCLRSWFLFLTYSDHGQYFYSFSPLKFHENVQPFLKNHHIYYKRKYTTNKCISKYITNYCYYNNKECCKFKKLLINKKSK